MEEWFEDKDKNMKVCHRIKNEVCNASTKFQEVRILDTYDVGRILVLDDDIQSAQSDEYIYHELLVHPSMLFLTKAESVLILGGGEGATLREVCKYKNVKKITMVDIDEELVTLCKKYLPSWNNGSFNDSRVELIFEDAIRYLTLLKKQRFDVIILDINTPTLTGPASKIYTKEFFQIIKNSLTKGNGIFVTQALEVFFNDQDLHSVVNKTCSSIFQYVDSYIEFIPSFSCMWGFVTCCETGKVSMNHPLSVDKNSIVLLNKPLLYYDSDCHKRVFSLPKVMREVMFKQRRISTFSDPVGVDNEK